MFRRVRRLASATTASVATVPFARQERTLRVSSVTTISRHSEVLGADEGRRQLLAASGVLAEMYLPAPALSESEPSLCGGPHVGGSTAAKRQRNPSSSTGSSCETEAGTATARREQTLVARGNRRCRRFVGAILAGTAPEKTFLEMSVVLSKARSYYNAELKQLENWAATQRLPL